MAEKVFQFGHQVDVAVPENRKNQVLEALNKFYTGKKENPDKPSGKLMKAISNVSGTYKVNITITVSSDGQLFVKLS